MDSTEFVRNGNIVNHDRYECIINKVTSLKDREWQTSGYLAFRCFYPMRKALYSIIFRRLPPSLVFSVLLGFTSLSESDAGATRHL